MVRYWNLCMQGRDIERLLAPRGGRSRNKVVRLDVPYKLEQEGLVTSRKKGKQKYYERVF